MIINSPFGFIFVIFIDQLKINYILLKATFSSVKFQPSSFIPDCVDYVETITIIQMTIPQMNLVTKYNVNRTGERIYALPLVTTGRFPDITVLQGKCTGKFEIIGCQFCILFLQRCKVNIDSVRWPITFKGGNELLSFNLLF